MSESAPSMRIQLFGGPEVHGHLETVRLSPFQLALVTLVYAEESISRPRVARILWRGEADARRRQSIRQLRHGIGRRVGEILRGGLA